MTTRGRYGYIFLKHQSDAFDQFKKFKALTEKQLDIQIKCLRTDNGIELCGKVFTEFCKKKGIVRHRTVPNTIAEWCCKMKE